MAQKVNDPTEPATKLLDGYIKEIVSRRQGAPVLADEIGDLTKEFVKRFMETCLKAEMDMHLEKSEAEKNTGENSGAQLKNKRNGHSQKTVTDGNVQVQLDIPRDRLGTFEPIAVGKYERRIPGLTKKILSMYARGMSNRDIAFHLEEIYGVLMSAESISRITDEVQADIREWRSRPLEDCYPVVFFDALRIKVRENGRVKSKSMYLALGITCDGRRDVLGM